MEAAEPEAVGPRWRSLLGDAVACMLLGAVVGFAIAEGGEAVAISVGLALPAGILLAVSRWAGVREGLRRGPALVKLAVSLACTMIIGTVASTFFPVVVGWDSLDDRWPEGLALGAVFVGLRLWELWHGKRDTSLPDHRRIA